MLLVHILSMLLLLSHTDYVLDIIHRAFIWVFLTWWFEVPQRVSGCLIGSVILSRVLRSALAAHLLCKNPGSRSVSTVDWLAHWPIYHVVQKKSRHYLDRPHPPSKSASNRNAWGLVPKRPLTLTLLGVSTHVDRVVIHTMKILRIEIGIVTSTWRSWQDLQIQMSRDLAIFLVSSNYCGLR